MANSEVHPPTQQLAHFCGSSATMKIPVAKCPSQPRSRCEGHEPRLLGRRACGRRVWLACVGTRNRLGIRCGWHRFRVRRPMFRPTVDYAWLRRTCLASGRREIIQLLRIEPVGRRLLCRRGVTGRHAMSAMMLGISRHHRSGGVRLCAIRRGGRLLRRRCGHTRLRLTIKSQCVGERRDGYTGKQNGS
jgi:hypothetical protein